jgi:hypothetical protein
MRCLEVGATALKTHRRVPLSHGAVIGVSTHRRIRCCGKKDQARPGVPRLRCHAWPKFWPFIFPWAHASPAADTTRPVGPILP